MVLYAKKLCLNLGHNLVMYLVFGLTLVIVCLGIVLCLGLGFGLGLGLVLGLGLIQTRDRGNYYEWRGQSEQLVN